MARHSLPPKVISEAPTSCGKFQNICPSSKEYTLTNVRVLNFPETATLLPFINDKILTPSMSILKVFLTGNIKIISDINEFVKIVIVNKVKLS